MFIYINIENVCGMKSWKVTWNTLNFIVFIFSLLSKSHFEIKVLSFRGGKKSLIFNWVNFQLSSKITGKGSFRSLIKLCICSNYFSCRLHGNKRSKQPFPVCSSEASEGSFLQQRFWVAQEERCWDAKPLSASSGCSHKSQGCRNSCIVQKTLFIVYDFIYI